MKITRLVAENVKRLKAVEIVPDPNDPVVLVRGKNGAGKSSVLDSILYTIAGKGTHPPKVIREGERHARVEIETEDMLVVRDWRKTDDGEDETTQLELRSKDGSKLKSPQALLDKLFDSVAFDALDFASMKRADQVETLQKLVGIDFTLIDRRVDAIFAERTNVNRDLAQLEARLKAMPGDKPPAPVDTAALLKARGEATNAQQWERQAKTERDAAMRRIDDCREAVKVAEQALAQAKVRLETATKQAAEADNVADDAEEKAAGVGARIAELDVQIQKASAIATANARWAEREKVEAEVARLREDTAAKTAQIDKLKAEKDAAIASAKFPVDGLGFGTDGVLYRGLPVEQASQAEQLRVSVAIGAARNPKFRVTRLKNGSLLDEDSMKLLAAFCRERDLQAWVEAVGESGPATVVIVNGEVRP